MAYTYLRVGTKPFRSKPPRKGPPCIDPFITGTNVLRDPSYELQQATFGTGPELADDIPSFLFGSTGPLLVWFSHPITQANHNPMGNESYWAQGWSVLGLTPGYENRRWLISTASPRTGSRHVRKVMFDPGDGYYAGGDVFSLNVFRARCGFSKAESGIDTYSTLVQPGNFIEWSVYVKASSTAASPTLTLQLIGVKPDWSDYSDLFVQQTFSLTVSYARYSISAFADALAGSCHVSLSVDHNTAGNPTTTVDIDDAALEVR